MSAPAPTRGAPQARVAPELDAARGAAALVVCAAHVVQIYLYPYFGVDGWLVPANGFLASHAVNLFFALSGYMIARSALRHRRPDGAFDARAFAVARAARLLPPYYFAVVLTIGVVLLIQGLRLYGAEGYALEGDLDVTRTAALLDWRSTLWSLTLLYGVFDGYGVPLYFNGPLWTLSFEFCLYVLALLFCLAHWNGSKTAAGLLIAAAVVAAFNAAAPFQTLAAIWSLGFACGLLTKRPSRLARSALAAGALSLGLLYIALALAHSQQLLEDPYASQWGRSAFIAAGGLFSVLIGLAGMRPADRPPPLPIVRLGRSARFSYTLYLIHFPLLMLAFSLLRPAFHPLGWIGALVCGSLAMACIVLAASALSRTLENRALFQSLLTRGWRPAAEIDRLPR